jgi:protein-tyrosine-phosphatase
MDEDLKSNLPPEKTYTLKEYAGLKGEIDDPWGKDLDRYIRCRDEMKDCLERIIERILREGTSSAGPQRSIRSVSSYSD